MAADKGCPLDDKVKAIADVLSLYVDDVDAILSTVPSPSKFYRFRCRFQLLPKEENNQSFSFAIWQSGRPVEITPRSFTIACHHVIELMEKVLCVANEDSEIILWKHCQAVHFHCTTIKDAMITLIYNAPLDKVLWTSHAQQLSKACSCSVIGRSRGTKVVIGRDFVVESFSLRSLKSENASTSPLQSSRDDASNQFDDSLHILMRQPEGAFSNPNPYICKQTMEWIRDRAFQMCTEASAILELYAGAATYTPILANVFSSVTVVEVNASLVDAAQINITNNKVTDCVNIVHAPVEQCLHILHTRGHNGTSFDAVMLDPPRDGMDSSVRASLKHYKHILLLSCSPVQTFYKDLPVLCKTHHIASAVVLDHFPQTKHVEAGIHLISRSL
eukprot:gene5695-8989_t